MVCTERRVQKRFWQCPQTPLHSYEYVPSCHEIAETYWKYLGQQGVLCTV